MSLNSVLKWVKTPSTGKKQLKGPKYTRFDPCGSSDTAKQSLPADTVEYVDKNFRKFIDKIIWVMLNLYLINYILKDFRNAPVVYSLSLPHG